ncbi:MAG: hypothetical protein AAFU64_14790 [Bacteroidota bacterium]
MHRNFFSIILLLFGFWQSSRAQELIPNAKVKLSIDEAKFQTILAKRKIPKSMLMMSAEEMEKVKGQLLGLSSVNFFYIKDWNFSSDPKTSPEYQHTDSLNDAALLLKLPGDPRQKAYDLAWTSLKYPLMAKRKYKLKIRYRLLADLDIKASTISDFYPTVFFLPDNGAGQPDWDKPLLSYPLTIEVKSAQKEHKRKKVLAQFQKEYGGSYDQDFAKDPDFQFWREESFTWKAPRKNIRFVAIVFQSKSENTAIHQKVSFLVDRISLRPLRLPGRSESAAEEGFGH